MTDVALLHALLCGLVTAAFMYFTVHTALNAAIATRPEVKSVTLKPMFWVPSFLVVAAVFLAVALW